MPIITDKCFPLASPYTQSHWSCSEAAKELSPMSLDGLSATSVTDWSESEQPTTLQLPGRRVLNIASIFRQITEQ
jgi:hypothetical protein